MSAEWLIVADDLTGACDSAVQFAHRGWTAAVPLDGEAPPADVDVVSISTDSRAMSACDAAAAIEGAAQRYSGRRVFKKIDSVLRGNPGAEIAAVAAAWGYDAVVATPAFPAMRRVTTAANAPEVARALRSDAHVEARGVAQALMAGARVVTANAASEGDLDAIAWAALAGERRVMLAGSAGLACAAARMDGRSAHPNGVRPGKRSVVFCIGSDHPATLGQMARLKRERPASVVLPLGPLPDTTALVLSGGDTAAAVCKANGARRIDLVSEVLAGTSWGWLRGGRFDGAAVVTKSGGFGAEDALVRIAEFFE